MYFRGGVLWLAPHCPKADNPACFTFGALPVEKARQDRFLLELGALLEEGLGRVRATGKPHPKPPLPGGGGPGRLAPLPGGAFRLEALGGLGLYR